MVYIAIIHLYAIVIIKLQVLSEVIVSPIFMAEEITALFDCHTIVVATPLPYLTIHHVAMELI
jgi:hypothetical protein